MRRRYALALLCGVAIWPVMLSAQQGSKVPSIGFLGAATRSATASWDAVFAQRLRELGWVDGRSIAIEYRWADSSSEAMSEIAAEFVRLKVDVIVTHSTAPVVAAMRATTATPIVFANSGDPVGTGLVRSLERPGGNVTGLSNQGSDTVGKRIELLREIVPGIRRLALLANVSNPGVVLEVREVVIAGRALGIEIVTSEIRSAEDIGPAFQALAGGADAVYVAADPLVLDNRSRINGLALDARLPTISSVRDFVEAGALISYGANFPDLWRRTAELVDKILRGAKPADIPIEQPTRFDLSINLKTAAALGLDLSPTLLARADEVIE